MSAYRKAHARRQQRKGTLKLPSALTGTASKRIATAVAVACSVWLGLSWLKHENDKSNRECRAAVDAWVKSVNEFCDAYEQYLRSMKQFTESVQRWNAAMRDINRDLSNEQANADKP